MIPHDSDTFLVAGVKSRQSTAKKHLRILLWYSDLVCFAFECPNFVAWEVVGYRLEVLKPMVSAINPHFILIWKPHFFLVVKINPHFILIWKPLFFWLSKSILILSSFGNLIFWLSKSILILSLFGNFFCGCQNQSSFDPHLETSLFCCQHRFWFDHYSETSFVLASKSNPKSFPISNLVSFLCCLPNACFFPLVVIGFFVPCLFKLAVKTRKRFLKGFALIERMKIVGKKLKHFWFLGENEASSVVSYVWCVPMIQRLRFEDLLRFHVDFRTSHALGGCNEDIWVISNEHSMRTSALGDQAGLCEDSSIEIVSDWIFMFSENNIAQIFARMFRRLKTARRIFRWLFEILTVKIIQNFSRIRGFAEDFSKMSPGLK